MNKYFYARYITLAMLLMVNNVSFSMGAKLVRYVAGSALVGGGSYVMDTELTKYVEKTWEDVPLNVEKWARRNLAAKGIKNAEVMPLKMGPGWSVERSLIAMEQNEVRELENCLIKQEMDDEDRKKEVLAQEMLFHEAKHYQSSDYGKRRLVYGLTSGILFLPHASVPRFFLKASMVVASNIAYIRHQELEADRFAFMNVPVEDLEICKSRRLQWAENFEDYISNDPCVGFNSGIKMRIGFLLSKRLHQLKQKEDSKQEKDMLIALVDLLHDHEHRRCWRQVALVQECIDKRKETE